MGRVTSHMGNLSSVRAPVDAEYTGAASRNELNWPDLRIGHWNIDSSPYNDRQGGMVFLTKKYSEGIKIIIDAGCLATKPMRGYLIANELSPKNIDPASI